MYGVPANLDLTFLHDAVLIQVCLSQYELQFHFHPIGWIQVESGWELLDETGNRIDGHCDPAERQSHLLHGLLGRRVVRSEVSAPNWFALIFEGGMVLRVFDDSEQYESFSIQPGNIFV